MKPSNEQPNKATIAALTGSTPLALLPTQEDLRAESRREASRRTLRREASRRTLRLAAAEIDDGEG